jgi:hypothetical protein
MIMDPDPRIVPSPISIRFAAHSTTALAPTPIPSWSTASGASVRKTQGWKLPSGLQRRELANRFPPQKTIFEPGQTDIIGRPRNTTDPSILAPRVSASAFQMMEGNRRIFPNIVPRAVAAMARPASHDLGQHPGVDLA